MSTAPIHDEQGKRDNGNSDLRQHALDVMTRQVGHLQRLVDDLLDVARINHDRVELRRENVSLASVVDLAVESCQALAAAAGVEGAGLGRGSEFTVRLPLRTQVERPAAASSPVEIVLPRRRVLVVDDNIDAAESLATLLQLSHHDTAMAHDGQAAIDLAESFRPDVVLLDIGLPKVSGHDAARRIRTQPWGRGMLLVALTGWGQERDLRRSREAGFDYHLVKPVDVAALMQLLASPKGAADAKIFHASGQR